MATVYFTSSDSFLDHDDLACERAEVQVTEYVEGTYEALRCGPDGKEIALYVDGAWQLPDGRRFSDWAVAVTDDGSTIKQLQDYRRSAKRVP